MFTIAEIAKAFNVSQADAKSRLEAVKMTKPKSTAKSTAKSKPLYNLYFDGGSRGNGKADSKAGSGSVIYKNSKEVAWRFDYHGSETNNYAECSGLLLGLKQAREMKIKDIAVYGDSKLVIMQISGKWKVNNEGLKEIYKKIKPVLAYFDNISFHHVLRGKNKRADELANIAMDTMKNDTKVL